MVSSAAHASPAGSPRTRRTGVLRIAATVADAGGTDGDVVLVLDSTFGTPGPQGEGLRAPGGPRLIAVRDVVERVLADRDLIEDTSCRLDHWASTSGVVDALTIEGTSFWYYVRLRHWGWLEERILWALIADDVITSERPASIVAATGIDEALADVLPLLAARHGIGLDVETEADPAPDPADVPGAPESIDVIDTHAAPPEAVIEQAATRPPVSRRRSLRRRLKRLRRQLLARVRPEPPPPPSVLDTRLDAIRDRVARLGAMPGRLLVVRQHDTQLVETPDGPRVMNPYLDPIVDRLRGTRLEPTSIELRGRLRRDADWERLQSPSGALDLTFEALLLDDVELAESELVWTPPAIPVEVAGVDLGPLLAADVVALARDWMPRMRRSVRRIELLLSRLRPAGVLLADEYHRQDWLTAARLAGIPVAAVQHGMIYPRHNGYMHADRPATLRLPARTYVFGRWERDLLVRDSVYRPDEVVVGGSPRLDLVAPDPLAAAALRDRLGIDRSERVVLLSGTWGRLYRRFHYPIALARLVDRALPGVRFVIKHHPGERDDGPYEAVIEAAAARGGFDPPPVVHLRDVDLYRALEAADAHLGIHSTVLTEAVVMRTPNLLAQQLYAADLLGYVDAGVATPIRDGGDLLAALDAGSHAMDEDAAQAFVTAHFEPGAAAQRIAGDLLAWLD